MANSFDALLLDLSGVLYDGDAAIPGAASALARVRRSGLTLRLITNTSQKTRGALMVGDDVIADVGGALDAGLRGCLVRTGKYRAGDEQKVAGGFSVVDSIVEAVELALGG